MTNFRLGVTGTRALRPEHCYILETAADKVADKVNEVTTGACKGVDSFFGRIMSAKAPEAFHRVILPSNRTQVDWGFEEWASEVEEMEPQTDYRDRNNRILDHSDYLVAFCEKPESHPNSQRSGTWMTVRLARKRGLGMRVYILEP